MKRISLLKSRPLYVFLSFICSIAVFYMVNAFQRMAYWGEDLTWFWVGVAITYVIWLTGIVFLVVAFTRKTKINKKLLLGLTFIGIVSFVFLLCGFCWTTFVIIFGLSAL